MTPSTALEDFQALRKRIRQHGGFFIVCRKVLSIWRQEGVGGVRMRLFMLLSRRQTLPPILERLWPLEKEQKRSPGRVALMVHVYYLDLLEELTAYLGNMPWTYDLLVSVTSADAEDEVRQHFSSLPHVNKLHIKVLPNKGRDIAPLLAGFNRELRDYEYIGHLHTKKSLYTGSEQVGWRHHIYDHLLGSPALVRQLFWQLAHDERLGMVYPRLSENIPHSAMTWLSNKGVGQALCQRLGIAFEPAAYFSYPAGSMFWAKRDALMPLLDLNLGYADFPTEEGQNDGTLHHATERLFSLVCRRQGLCSAVIYLDTQRLRENDDFNLHQYFNAPVGDKIRRFSADHDQVTVDVFDTLITRPFATPDRMFEFLAEVIRDEHGIDDFFTLRKQAEHHARSTISKDPGLEDIYTSMATLGLPAEQTQRLKTLELETEARLWRLRTAVCDGLRQADTGEPLLGLSDMYLPSAFILEQLHARGFTQMETLWVSNELNLRKDNGSLWHHLKDGAGTITRKRVLHIGDNEHSDVQLPSDINAALPLHVMRAETLLTLGLQGSTLLRFLPRGDWQQDLLFGLLARHAQQRIDQNPQLFYSRGFFSRPEDIGYALLGPMAFHFLQWVIARAREDKVDKLLFMARDSYILYVLYQRLQALTPSDGQPLPEAAYFSVSRLATGLMAIHEASDLPKLMQRHFDGTLSDFLTYRMDERLADLWPGSPETLEERFTLPEDARRLQHALAPLTDDILALARDSRDAYRAYLEDIAGGQTVGLVDLGYSATIQRQLQQGLQYGFQGYYLMTLRAAGEAARQGGRAQGCLVEGAASPMAYPLLGGSLLLEALMVAPHGQVKRVVQHADGSTEALYSPLELDDAAFDYARRAQLGAEAFVDDALEALDNAWWRWRIDPSYLEAMFQAMREGILDIQDVLDVIAVEDGYGGHGTIQAKDFMV